MLTLRRPGQMFFFALAAAFPVVASAQGVVTPQPVGTETIVQTSPATTPPNMIGSHQIDRFEAIRQLQTDLKSDANNIANWTILGELAHEVALDIPQGQDEAYYTLSRQAYEHAAQLDPTNNGLKSALQFAREQETNAAAFDARRSQGVSTYLEARRREMAANGVIPTLRVYETPTMPTPTTTAGQPATPTYGSAYPTPTYRPYYNQQANQPYSYNQFSNGYVPPTTTGTTTSAPTTLRQFGQQLPGVLLNAEPIAVLEFVYSGRWWAGAFTPAGQRPCCFQVFRKIESSPPNSRTGQPRPRV